MASRREAAAGYVPSVAVDVADLAVDSPCASELPHRLRRHLPTEVDDAIPALAGLARLRSVDTPQPHALAGDYQCVAVEHLFPVARAPARRLGARGFRNSGQDCGEAEVGGGGRPRPGGPTCGRRPPPTNTNQTNGAV